MKKIAFGSVAALCAVAGLSSFKTSYFADRYYFTAKTGVSKVGLTTWKNADVTILAAGSASPSSPGCTGTTKDCVVSFTINQVTATNQTHLKTSVLIPSQTNKTVIYTRS